MGGKKAPVERLRGVSHLENEGSRQAFSMGHTTRCSGQYSPGDMKTALVLGGFTHWTRGLNMKGFFKRKKSASREIAGCVTPREWMVKASLFGAHTARYSGQYSPRTR